jgi:hypothetical protein
MAVSDNLVVDPKAPASRWRRPILGIIWFVCATTLGFIAMAVRAEHGSIVYFLVGLEVAVIGAAAGLVLPSVASFGRLGATGRSAVLAAAAAASSIAYSAASLLSRTSPTDSSGDRLAFLAPLAIVAIVIAGATAVIVARLETWWDA